MKSLLREQLKHIPSLPGVYVFRDGEGSVVYVGKAKELKKRVKQYFIGTQQYRTARFVPLIDTVETIIAGSEKEALLLERNLIKRYKPPYNIEETDTQISDIFLTGILQHH